MKKKALAAFICLVILPLVVIACSAPEIPHEITVGQSCLKCHGLDGVKPYPERHERKAYDDDSCLDCHTPQVIAESGE